LAARAAIRKHQRIHIAQRFENHLSQQSDGLNSFNIEIRGTIEVSDDDRDISNMSHDGYFEVTKTSFGSRRTIKITREGSVLIKRYYEGRTEINFDPEGRKWLAEILPEVVRTTTIAAESRVNRFYSKGGTQAVLTEIDAIKSDHVKSYYARMLMKKPVLEKDYATLIHKVTGNMHSDHYISEFLQDNLHKFCETKKQPKPLLQLPIKWEAIITKPRL
jgi:hypothetical protein